MSRPRLIRGLRIAPGRGILRANPASRFWRASECRRYLARPNKLLVIQFPYEDTRSAAENLAFRHELEEVLDAALRRNGSGEVDGGEIGPHGINIWVYLKTWSHGLPVIEAHLNHRKLLHKAIVAKKISEDRWQVV